MATCRLTLVIGTKYSNISQRLTPVTDTISIKPLVQLQGNLTIEMNIIFTSVFSDVYNINIQYI